MSYFCGTEYFEVIHCCNCGVPFAIEQKQHNRLQDNHKWFYCPNGHSQHFTGPSEAQRLRADLERKTQMLDAATARADSAEGKLHRVSNSNRKMRVRIANGVCPCCNRTFQNLMAHMKSEHPAFSKEKTMLSVRSAFGITQGDVAKEAGVNPAYVSLYERGKPLAPYAKKRLDDWLSEQTATENHE